MIVSRFRFAAGRNAMFNRKNLVRLFTAGSDGGNADDLISCFQAGLLSQRVRLDPRDDGLVRRPPFRKRQAMQIQLPAEKLPCVDGRLRWELHSPRQIALRTVATA